MSLFRIDGVISGLNTSDILDRLDKVERAPIARIQQRQATVAGRLAAWQTVNTRLLALRDRAAALGAATTYTAVSARVSDARVLVASATPPAWPGTYEITIDDVASAHQVRSDSAFADPEAPVFGGGTLSIVTGGETTEVVIEGPDSSLSGIARAINTSGARVRASVVRDTAGYRLVLGALATGSASAITVTPNLAGGTASLGSWSDLQPARDARVVLGSGPGALVLERSTNLITDLVPGVTLALIAPGRTTLWLDRDLEAPVHAVAAFVAAYNELVTHISQYVRYDPHSRSAGLLIGDGTLLRIERVLTTAVMDAPVEGGTVTRPVHVGLTLGRDGRLSVEATVLRSALSQAPDDARGLLTALGERIGQHLEPLLRTGGTLSGVVAHLRQQITGLDRQGELWEARVAQRRQRYLRTFAALEESLATLRTQSEWLSRQIATLARGADR